MTINLYLAFSARWFLLSNCDFACNHCGHDILSHTQNCPYAIFEDI